MTDSANTTPSSTPEDGSAVKKANNATPRQGGVKQKPKTATKPSLHKPVRVSKKREALAGISSNMADGADPKD